MTAHGRVRLVAELEQRPDRRRDLVSLIIVENVRYEPRWSLEVERIIAVDVNDLPADLAPIAGTWIDAIRPHLEDELGLP